MFDVAVPASHFAPPKRLFPLPPSLLYRHSSCQSLCVLQQWECRKEKLTLCSGHSPAPGPPELPSPQPLAPGLHEGTGSRAGTPGHQSWQEWLGKGGLRGLGGPCSPGGAEWHSPALPRDVDVAQAVLSCVSQEGGLCITTGSTSDPFHSLWSH